MNADEVMLRLSAFNSDTPVQIAIPIGPGGGPPDVFLPIVRMGHHGLDPDVISEDPQSGLELFTLPWNTLQPAGVNAAGVTEMKAPPYVGKAVTAGEIVQRMQQHHDQTNIRIAVPCEVGVHDADVKHHRILHIEVVGFARNAVPVDGVLPVEIVTEGWESLARIIRLDE